MRGAIERREDNVLFAIGAKRKKRRWRRGEWSDDGGGGCVGKRRGRRTVLSLQNDPMTSGWVGMEAEATEANSGGRKTTMDSPMWSDHEDSDGNRAVSV